MCRHRAETVYEGFMSEHAFSHITFQIGLIGIDHACKWLLYLGRMPGCHMWVGGKIGWRTQERHIT